MIKAIVLVDIPEDGVHDMLASFETKVSLDYADKVVYLTGVVRAIPEKDKSFARNNAYHYQCGWNACIDAILRDSEV